jgi:iron(III) transport system substrate-binding protein
MSKTVKALLTACALAATAGATLAQEQVVNLYSARHYSTDEALYTGFTKATGIKINRVDADDAGILARLKAEGSASPADVILLVDAARLYKGEVDGLFQPIQSKVLNDAIPANLRSAPAADGGISWFGLSTRARVIVYNKVKVQKADVDTYEELGDPKNKGKLCIRSGSHPYNLSLFGAVTEHLGEQKAEAWLKGVVANLARPPKGGDTDQIKAVASGECDIGVTNSYYLARMMRSNKPEDVAVVNKVGVVFPNQAVVGHAPEHCGRRSRQTRQKQGKRRQVPRIPGKPRSAKLLRQRQQRVAGGQERDAGQPCTQGHDGQCPLQERNHSHQCRGSQRDQGAADAGPRRLPVTPSQSTCRRARHMPGFFVCARAAPSQR